MKDQKNTIFIDTETTGLSHEHDEVLEITLINGEGTVLLDTLVKPVSKTEWPQAEAIHGISPAMIKAEASLTLPELAPTIAGIINNHEHTVVYNLDYDQPFIEQAIHEAGITLPLDTTWHCAMLDFAHAYGEWNHQREEYKWQRLAFAAEHVGHEWQGKAHRALADCQATLSVWNWLRLETILNDPEAYRGKDKRAQP